MEETRPVTTKLDPEYGPELAQRYAQEYTWSDELAMEASIRLNSAYAAQVAALGRFFRSLGMEKRESRYSVLRILYFAETPRTQNDLRVELNVTSPNVTYLIDGLEREGLVTRVAHPSDRRTGFVELTAKGRELAAALVPGMAEFMGEMSKGMTDDEKRTLIELLDKFHRNAINSYFDE
jgi:DNA-binding MarR family transcriptional regulator